ncbi:hypothetical protein MFRU_004g00740 [Monilinia fructicola]|nr:hypothetical protein MFRU_004g00740 [Monilinia fructicola]
MDPSVVTGTTCIDPLFIEPIFNRTLVSHDINVVLGICGIIANTTQQLSKLCGGEPSSTTQESGTTLLKLNAATVGQTIDITKGRWERCMRTEQASITSTCIRGANVNAGNVDFELSAA